MLHYVTSKNVPLTFKPPSARVQALALANAQQLTATPRPQPPMIEFDIGPAPNPNDPQYLVDLEAWYQQVDFILLNHLIAVALQIDPAEREKSLAFLDEFNSDTSDIDAYIAMLEAAGNANPVLDYQSYIATMMQCNGGNHPSVRYVWEVACQTFNDVHNVVGILRGQREEAAVTEMAATF